MVAVLRLASGVGPPAVGVLIMEGVEVGDKMEMEMVE
jgi:hypothetical protein